MRSLRDFGRHRSVATDTDRYKMTQTGTGQVATDTDQYKIVAMVLIPAQAAGAMQQLAASPGFFTRGRSDAQNLPSHARTRAYALAA